MRDAILQKRDVLQLRPRLRELASVADITPLAADRSSPLNVVPFSTSTVMRGHRLEARPNLFP
jgi:hypothetical protein